MEQRPVSGCHDHGGGEPLTKTSLRKLHGPIAYISGDEEDLAFANANDDFERIDQVLAFRAFARGGLHEGTYLQRNGGEFAGIAVGWLNRQLKGTVARPTCLSVLNVGCASIRTGSCAARAAQPRNDPRNNRAYSRTTHAC